ncbi:MAG: hypothetical protein IJK12_05955 [Clostridia bacterium]|nr:hypothetical protein [Clostridia bacterium]
MKQYKGNRFPFCCALYTAVDAPEAVAVIETLERQRIRCAVPVRRREDCIARASVVLLFLSPEAAHDEAVLKGVNAACAAGKTILTVFLRETWMSPGLSMQLGQMQAIPKFREESDESFYEKLLNAPALRTMSVTQQQKKALRRRSILWAIGGVFVLTAAVLIGLYWRPLKAMLPSSPLQKLGVTNDFDNVETLYVYGETKNDAYVPPHYRICADGDNDWADLGDRMIPQGGITAIDDFAILRNLREFCFCNNPVDTIRPIFSLKRLTLLDVSHNRLTQVRGIGALSELETLNVSHNPLSGLDDIAKLPALRTLNISYTDITSLDALLSMPSLETVCIDARLLDAANELGETPFEIVCVDTPVYGYADLLRALNDPNVTDIRLMESVIVPQDGEIVIPSGVVLNGCGEKNYLSVHGTVRVRGVWVMDSRQYNYGTIVVEDGGVCSAETAYSVNRGTFRVEKGGRHNLRRGASFSMLGGRYENNGDVWLRSKFSIEYLRGDIVNNGALHLRTLDMIDVGTDIPLERIVNNGIVYVDGLAVLDATRLPDGNTAP